MIKDEYIEKAKDSVELITLFKDLHPNAKIRKCGSRYRCNCVFHEDSTPSLYLDPVTNLVHCFGCNKTLDKVGLVMESTSRTFPEAVKYLLGNYAKIENLSEIYIGDGIESNEEDKRKESQMIAMQLVQEYYTGQYTADYEYAKACRDYAEKRKDNTNGRWDSDKIMTFGFGYAPASGHALVDYAIKKGLNLETLVDIGVLVVFEDKNNRLCYKDLFRNRLTIPQRDAYGRVIAFTARTLGETARNEPKYMNSKCTDHNLIYKKDKSIFGIDLARKAAKVQNVIYLVEGAPDVVGLNTLGILNVVACNGGTWSRFQLDKLRSISNKLCFIPDSDTELVDVDGTKVRRGESFVIKNAALALSFGFWVKIKEIPGKLDEKRDADSYFKTIKRWESVHEKDFIEWYAEKIFSQDSGRDKKLESIANICNMLANIPDTSRRVSYLDEMKESYPPKKFWNIEIKRAVGDLQERTPEQSVSNEAEYETDSYGFMTEDNKYFVYQSNGKKHFMTNFIARGIFHITGETDVTRVFEIINTKGNRQILEVCQSNITKLDKMKEVIERMGNFRYKATPWQHELFKDYLYDNMPSVIRLERVGWHSVGDGGFLVFGNGIGIDGVFHSVDCMGIVEYGKRKYFLPAFSVLYEDKAGEYKDLKRFEHIVKKELTIEMFFCQVIKVYPEHGMQELAFVLATMFLDIIREESGFFPLMFHYGISESGKTQLAITATRFFQLKEEISNIENTSLWAMNNKATSGTNILCHWDEYKTDVGKERNDYFKGLFDNAGRMVRKDMSSKRHHEDIETGHIFTGQELPNYDPALMTRSILMEFYNDVRSTEEIIEMDKLKDMRDWGVTQLTLKIVCYRQSFKSRWQDVWLDCLIKVKNDEHVQNVGERIIETWTILYAVVKCLDECGLETPIDINKLYDMCIYGMARQQELLKLTDEVAIFWLLMKNSYRYGEIHEMAHFNVKTLDKPMALKRNRESLLLTPSPRPVLMLCMDACIGVVNRRGAEEKKQVLNEATLMSYLKNTPEYLGTMEAPTKFKMVDKNGEPILVEILDKKTGEVRKCVKRITDRAMIFDYYKLRDKYDIHLVQDGD